MTVSFCSSAGARLASLRELISGVEVINCCLLMLDLVFSFFGQGGAFDIGEPSTDMPLEYSSLRIGECMQPVTLLRVPARS
jgi:hypothetical protein